MDIYFLEKFEFMIKVHVGGIVYQILCEKYELESWTKSHKFGKLSAFPIVWICLKPRHSKCDPNPQFQKTSVLV